MANISLILLQDVENLGLAGEEIHVAPGYARNYLIPRKLAAKSTPATLRRIEANRAQIEAKRAEELAAAQALGEKLKEVELSIPMQATADEQLFGAVTARVIAEGLEKSGFSIPHTRIKLDAPIKLLGSYDIDVKLHADVTVPVKVYVVRG